MNWRIKIFAAVLLVGIGWGRIARADFCGAYGGPTSFRIFDIDYSIVFGHLQRGNCDDDGDGRSDTGGWVPAEMTCTNGEGTRQVIRRRVCVSQFGDQILFSQCGVQEAIDACAAAIIDAELNEQERLEEIRRAQEEARRRAEAARQEAEREARRRALEEQQIRDSLRPMELVCRPLSRDQVLGWTNEFGSYILECEYGCGIQECGIFSSVSCNVMAICDATLRNCDMNQPHLDSCANACRDEMRHEWREQLAACETPPEESEEVSLPSPADLSAPNDGDDSPWAPDGGWEEEEEDVAGAGAGEGVGNEDVPERAEGGGAPAAGEGETGGYGRGDYQAEVMRRYLENLRQAGPNPTPEARQDAAKRAVADARTEMNHRSVAGQYGEIEEQISRGNSMAARLAGARSENYEGAINDYQGDQRQSHPGAIPTPRPSNGMTASAVNRRNAGLIGEGDRGPTVGDPVINGIFCYDKIFAKENVPFGPPVELSGRYCGDSNPEEVLQGALGPGWGLNVESSIFYSLGSRYLSYQNAEGGRINFALSDGQPLTAENLQNACSVGLNYSADFIAVGAPLKLHADIHINRSPANCHQIVFEFLLKNGAGNKTEFRRVYDFSDNFTGAKELENGILLSDRASENIDRMESFATLRESLPDLRLADHIQGIKSRVRQRNQAASDVWMESDPGPLGMILLSQSFAEQRELGRWEDASIHLEDGTLARMVLHKELDAGFFTDSNMPGRFVSFALSNIVVPVVKWEDAAGNATTIERRTLYQKYFTGRLSARGWIDQRVEVDPIQEREESFRGNPVTSYSFDSRMIKERNHSVQFTLYETQIPKATETIIRNGDRSIALTSRYRLEHDITASADYKENELFPAPIEGRRKEDRDIMVLHPRPVLASANGNGKVAAFRYGYVSGAGVCNRNEAPGGEHMAFMSHNEAGPGARNAPGDCHAAGPLLQNSAGGNFFGGPLILTAWTPPSPTTGRAIPVFDGSGVKPEFFLYEPANVPNSLYSPRMTETGFLNAQPSNQAGVENTFAENIRETYIRNTYDDENRVSMHQLGQSGAIQYGYLFQNGRSIVNVLTRGDVSHSFEYEGGKLIRRTLNPAGVGGLPSLTTEYAYASAPADKPYLQGRLQSMALPSGERLEYAYRDAGDDLQRYDIREVNRISTEGRRVLVGRFDYDDGGAAHGFLSKITSAVRLAPATIDGNETVTLQHRYDYQEADLNPCNANRPQGNLVKVIYPDGTFESWKHNVHGQPIFHRNRAGAEINFSYYGTGEGCGP